MSKKSSATKYMESYYSETTIRCYNDSIRLYESYHNMDIDELVEEALDEQRANVSEDMLKIYDRLYDFREHLCKSMKDNSVKSHYHRIIKVYKMNRVKIPYIPPLNPKVVKRSPKIEYEDILTKEEIRRVLDQMNSEQRARAMCMATGGFASAEADSLTREQFYEDLKLDGESYTECMKRLSKTDNVIWVTKLERKKTKKVYYGLVNPETVQMIASNRMHDTEFTGKLFTGSKKYFGNVCYRINEKLGLGYAGDRCRLSPHAFRRFHATHISGAVLSYEEKLQIDEIDELQGRGKTKTQDAYMKTNKMRQKVLYAKVMNNVSIYNQYDYEIVDDDVVVTRIDASKEVQKVKRENIKLKEQIKNNGRTSPTLKNYIKDVGIDNFIDQINELLID